MTSKSSKFHLLCIILILNLTTISAFTCKFTDHKFDDDQLLYTCEITSQTTNNPETHLTAKTDADVKAFTIDGISHLNSSELPFCERFSNFERVKIFGANFIDQNFLKKCSNLTFVSIKNGKIEKLSENLFSENLQLNFVELSNLNLKELPEKIFNNLKNLKGLTITSNELIHLPPKIFNSQQKLGILFLGSNGFKSLNPIWFENLQNLAFLELSFNKIENLPKNVFKSLINLQHLWLWANELTVIHADSFGTHSRLKNVDLRQNKINEIDGKLLESLAVESLDMEIQNVCFRGKITNKSDLRKKLKKCLENYKPRKESKLQCGTHKIGKETILGGTEIEQGSYPWNAGLETTEGKYICGGTLVSNKSIVTAAHCLMNNPEESIYEPSNIKVLLGGHNLNIPESNRISASVKSINIHSEWNSHDADIAVLELNDEIQFNDFIQPICLIEEDAEKFENLPAKIVGFENSENIAKVFVVKIQNCNKIDEFEALLGPRTFCSGYEDGIGSCRGDIGSGLIIEKDGNFYLRGIVSASLRNIKNDCEETEHLMLTDVVKFTSFIKSDGRDVFDDKLRLLKEENEKLKERVKELQEALNKKNGRWLSDVVPKAVIIHNLHTKLDILDFLKNEIVAREWARLAGRDDLAEKKIDTLIKYYLCSDHFTQNDFANPEIEDKSFLTLNRSQNFVPLPSKFENNLQQNVQVVVKNAEKFMKIPKQRICDRKLTKTSKRKFNEKLQKVEILSNEILEAEIEIQRIDEYPTDIEYIEEIILVCRLCTKPECELLPIFNENGELSTETECFKLMPASVIQFNDGHPQHVCFNCLDKLQSCANIIDGFVMNQNAFGS